MKWWAPGLIIVNYLLLAPLVTAGYRQKLKENTAQDEGNPP